MKYTLSFYTKENQPKIKYPNFLKFWERAELIYNEIWIRKIVNIDFDNEKEALAIFNSEILRETIKQIHPDAKCLQLELGNDNNTNYINCSSL